MAEKAVPDAGGSVSKLRTVLLVVIAAAVVVIAVEYNAAFQRERQEQRDKAVNACLDLAMASHSDTTPCQDIADGK